MWIDRKLRERGWREDLLKSSLIYSDLKAERATQSSSFMNGSPPGSQPPRWSTFFCFMRLFWKNWGQFWTHGFRTQRGERGRLVSSFKHWVNCLVSFVSIRENFSGWKDGHWSRVKNKKSISPETRFWLGALSVADFWPAPSVSASIRRCSKIEYITNGRVPKTHKEELFLQLHRLIFRVGFSLLPQRRIAVSPVEILL